jgi:hypothetical protein
MFRDEGSGVVDSGAFCKLERARRATALLTAHFEYEGEAVDRERSDKF